MRRTLFMSAVILVFAHGSAVASAPHSAHQPYVVRVATHAGNVRIVRAERARGTRVTRVYRHVFPGFAAMLAGDDLRRIRRYSQVVAVLRGGEVRTVASTERRATSTGLWGLDRIDQRALPLDGRIVTASAGAGVDAYVVDSGIRSAQQQFAGRLLPGFGAVADGRGTEDCNGHGTRVAGAIAGSETGVAPGAWITPVRVIGCSGQGDSTTLIAGLDWIVGDHREGAPAVANISLVGPRSPLVNDAVAAVVDDGVPVAVAAGNSPVDACTQSPASAPDAVTVAAMTEQDTAASFSAVGPCVDVYAPGYAVLTTATIKPPRRSHQLVLASGTSMSSAFVAGAVALHFAPESTRTPAQVQADVMNSATEGALADVPAGTPNRLLYVGDGSPPAPVAQRPPTTRVFSRVAARFTPTTTRRAGGLGRFRASGVASVPGTLTVTRAGRLIARARVAAGTFSIRSRLARRISVLRLQVLPDDPDRTVASVLVPVANGRP